MYFAESSTVKRVRCVKFTQIGHEEKNDVSDLNDERDRIRPKYLDDYVTVTDNYKESSVDVCYKVLNVPRTYDEVISSPESIKRQTAMDEEMKALNDNDTYDLTPLPQGLNPVAGSGYVQ